MNVNYMPTGGGVAPAARVPVLFPSVKVAVSGCHGGAGATTLSRLLFLCGVCFFDHSSQSVTPDPRSVFLPGWQVVVTARGNAQGVRRAQKMVAYLAEQGFSPSCVMLMADCDLPEPRVVRLRRELLDAVVPVVTVPFVTSWRSKDVEELWAEDVPPKVWRKVKKMSSYMHAHQSGGVR